MNLNLFFLDCIYEELQTKRAASNIEINENLEEDDEVYDQIPEETHRTIASLNLHDTSSAQFYETPRSESETYNIPRPRNDSYEEIGIPEHMQSDYYVMEEPKVKEEDNYEKVSNDKEEQFQDDLLVSLTSEGKTNEHEQFYENMDENSYKKNSYEKTTRSQSETSTPCSNSISKTLSLPKLSPRPNSHTTRLVSLELPVPPLKKLISRGAETDGDVPLPPTYCEAKENKEEEEEALYLVLKHDSNDSDEDDLPERYASIAPALQTPRSKSPMPLPRPQQARHSSYEDVDFVLGGNRCHIFYFTIPTNYSL